MASNQRSKLMEYNKLQKYSVKPDETLNPATLRNHVVVSGSKEELKKFLEKTYHGLGTHKLRHKQNSHSEDALTWSCFDVLRNLPQQQMVIALNEIMEDAFDGKPDFEFKEHDDIKIEIGKKYVGQLTKEESEIDVSIEIPNKLLVFIEAKLYGSISMPKDNSPCNQKNNSRCDQIAKKLRVGVDCREGRTFYFIFLDLAPWYHLYLHKEKKVAKKPSNDPDKFFKKPYLQKWSSAWWFDYYKKGRNNSKQPLKNVLNGEIDGEKVLESLGNDEQLDALVEEVSQNMGWLTWSDLYKTVLRGLVTSMPFSAKK